MTFQSPVVRSITSLREVITGWYNNGKTVALVPTMGALHEGHLSLVELAQKKADHTVVSIFVNPAQFAPHEDLDTYPRDETADRNKLSHLRTNLIYAPPREQMYASDFSTKISVEGISNGLCGDSRPNFFSGVATVVCKLLFQVSPNFAIFGEKDYQQLMVIRRMVRDLDIPVQIIGAPIIREADGLAMSSRNAYLSEQERSLAPKLQETIHSMAVNIAMGEPIGDQLQLGITSLKADGFKVDYLEARDANNLAPIYSSGPVHKTKLPAIRIFAAAYLGKTRLIDNVAVPAAKSQ